MSILNLIHKIFSIQPMAFPKTELVIHNPPVIDVKESELKIIIDPIEILTKNSLLSIVDFGLNSKKCSDGWTHYLMNDGISMYVYDDDYDLASIRIAEDLKPIYDLRQKHGTLWIKGRDIPEDISDHPNRLTFGVCGFKPLDTMKDYNSLPVDAQVILHQLASSFHGYLRRKREKDSRREI